RRVALRAARRPDRAGDAVARDQLAAAHLGGRDVDVAVARLAVGRDAHEARAVAHQVEHALDRPLALVLLVAAVRRRLRLGLRLRLRRLPALVAAAAAPAATAATGATAALLVLRGRGRPVAVAALAVDDRV